MFTGKITVLSLWWRR